ncbi:MAG TPA: hypothetical protein VGR28_03515 [Candidatus Thermoplasmatota archaeon]|nr:hypothetical protein [Candidatus Thermoplasmatota archaeon]
MRSWEEFEEGVEHLFFTGSWPWEQLYINWCRKREGKKPFPMWRD